MSVRAACRAAFRRSITATTSEPPIFIRPVSTARLPMPISPNGASSATRLGWCRSAPCFGRRVRGGPAGARPAEAQCDTSRFPFHTVARGLVGIAAGPPVAEPAADRHRRLAEGASVHGRRLARHPARRAHRPRRVVRFAPARQPGRTIRGAAVIPRSSVIGGRLVSDQHAGARSAGPQMAQGGATSIVPSRFQYANSIRCSGLSLERTRSVQQYTVAPTTPSAVVPSVDRGRPRRSPVPRRPANP